MYACQTAFFWSINVCMCTYRPAYNTQDDQVADAFCCTKQAIWALGETCSSCELGVFAPQDNGVEEQACSCHTQAKCAHVLLRRCCSHRQAAWWVGNNNLVCVGTCPTY